MKWLPVEKLSYQTQLKQDEILRRLDKCIGSGKPNRFGFFPPDREFEGKLTDTSFEMRRVIRYRNSFIPRITGSISSNLSGTIIDVRMRLHTFVLVFFIIWMSLVGMVALIFLLVLTAKEHFEPAMLIPFAMLLAGYGITLGGFKWESISTKRRLKDLFEAEVTEC